MFFERPDRAVDCRVATLVASLDCRMLGMIALREESWFGDANAPWNAVARDSDVRTRRSDQGRGCIQHHRQGLRVLLHDDTPVGHAKVAASWGRNSPWVKLRWRLR